MFHLAETLGKFMHEVEELSAKDLAEWLAYFKIKREEEANALKKRKQQQATSPKAPRGRRR